MSANWELCQQHGGIGKRRTCAECNLYPNTCPSEGCGWIGTLRDLTIQRHQQACETACEYVNYTCPKCAWIFDSYTRHGDKCPTTTKRRK